jgi:ribosomal protein S18 acetylase RimI-like enzyme
VNVVSANALPLSNGKHAAPGAAGVLSPLLPTGYAMREFSPADYDEAIALWRSCEGIGLNDSDALDAIGGFLSRNPGLIFVVEHASPRRTIVGTLLCGHDGRRGSLYHLAVAAAHRRRGLGRALVETSLARLRLLGIVKCNLFLFANNTAGRAFWVGQGWAAREDLVIVQQVLKR